MYVKSRQLTCVDVSNQREINALRTSYLLRKRGESPSQQQSGARPTLSPRAKFGVRSQQCHSLKRANTRLEHHKKKICMPPFNSEDSDSFVRARTIFAARATGGRLIWSPGFADSEILSKLNTPVVVGSGEH